MHLLRRLGASLLLVLLVVSATFLLLHLAPGEPSTFLLDPRIPPSQQTRLQEIYGLDRPLGQQYVAYLGAVLRGDLGTSFSHRRPVAKVLAEALPETLLLGLAALLVQTAVALPLGMAAARARGRTDRWLRLTTLTVYSLPVFWVALMAAHFFGRVWPILPTSQAYSVHYEELSLVGRFFDVAWHLVLPAGVLGLTSAAGVSRFLRNSLLETTQQGFVIAARARGLSERRVLWVHTLRHAAIPVVQLMGLSLPFLLSGSLVIEVIFARPGVGSLAYRAVLAQDIPMVLATTTLTAILVILGNLFADLGHAALDPRVRHV